jgi:hypothetical protein
MQPLPDHSVHAYPQESGEYLSIKRCARNDEMRLDRFMELANITITNLDDHAIVFLELNEMCLAK